MEMTLPQYCAEMERPLGLLPSTGLARARSPPPLLRLSESASVTDRVREASGANSVGRTFSFCARSGERSDPQLMANGRAKNMVWRGPSRQSGSAESLGVIPANSSI
jgi:hypothetical protein